MIGLSAWMAPVPALAGLLLVAGAAKLVRPGDTARALRQSGLPVGVTSVRVGALVEVGIGFLVLAGGGRVGIVLLGLSYAAFAGFVGLALVTGKSISSCGCFGEPDTPPTLAHVAVCGAGAIVAGAAALSNSSLPGLWGVLGREPMSGVVFLMLSGLGAYAAYLVMAVAPRLTAARILVRAKADR